MWSQTKKQIKGFLCDKLKDRVDFFCSNYRMQDGIGRAYITVDGKEIYNMCSLKSNYYFGERKPGVYSQIEFMEAIKKCMNSSIEELLTSDNTLIKMLVIIDRRVGKRTLEKMKDKIINEEEIVQYLYKLRCCAEGIE